MHLRVIDKAKGRRRLKTRIEWRHDKSFDHDKWYVEDCIRSSINPPSTDSTSRKKFRLNLGYVSRKPRSKTYLNTVTLQGLKNKLIISRPQSNRTSSHLYFRALSIERRYKSHRLTIIDPRGYKSSTILIRNERRERKYIKKKKKKNYRIKAQVDAFNRA